MSSYAWFAVLLAGVAATSSGWAQSASVVSQPVASQSGTPGQSAQGTPAPVPTMKTTAQLVVVDVVVTDKDHRPVHGLKAAEFSLAENGRPQAIRNFEEHTALSAADASKFPPMPKMPPGIFTNFTPAPASGAVNILLLDSLNTPIGDQAYMRQQLLAYLKTTPPGTRIAIFGLSTHLVLLQGFTSDPSVLRSIVEKSSGKASFVLEDKVGGAGIQSNQTDLLEDQATDPAFDDAVPARIIANLREFDAAHETLQLLVRTKFTLDAMNEIARYVSGISGRKNLIWFSGSFPLDVLPDETGAQANPFRAMGSSEDEYRETITKLARSQVAVYPVDVRGVAMSSVNDASSHYTGALAGKRMLRDEAKFLDTNAAEHATLDVLAADTGGRAFFNTNGLTEAVAKAVEEGSNFYTLSYTPINQERDGKLRKINVQLARPGTTLAYRSGYYADAPAKNGTTAAANAANGAETDQAGQESLERAMMRGAPTPAEILIKVAVARMTAGGRTEDVIAPGNIAAPASKGPYDRYGVDYAIAPGDLVHLAGADGMLHVDYDVMVYVYDANGELLNWIGSTHHIVSSAEQLQRGTMHGIRPRVEISAPAKSVSFLRIAVHDRNRDRYGAVEVATSQVRDVAAANAGPVAPAAGPGATAAPSAPK